MFDEQSVKDLNNPAVAPKNLPVEPDDMLAGVESGVETENRLPNALSAGVLKKKTSEAQPAMGSGTVGVNPAGAVAVTKGPILGKMIFVLLGLGVLGGAGYGGWWLFQNKESLLGGVNKTVSETPVVETTKQDTLPIDTAPVVVSTSTDTAAATAGDQMKNDAVLFGEPIDTDKDNLDDIREKQIGTNSQVADTDGDGLSDGDEVLIWKTDPLNPDTDGDGFVDGVEVQYGYNPNGPGKLFNNTTVTNTATGTIKK